MHVYTQCHSPSSPGPGENDIKSEFKIDMTAACDSRVHVAPFIPSAPRLDHKKKKNSTHSCECVHSSCESCNLILVPYQDGWGGALHAVIQGIQMNAGVRLCQLGNRHSLRGVQQKALLGVQTSESAPRPRTATCQSAATGGGLPQPALMQISVKRWN